MYDERNPLEKDRLGVMLSEAEEIYKEDSYNPSVLDSWAAGFKGEDKAIAQRIRFVFQAKKVYDLDCQHGSQSPFRFWVASRLDGERVAATLIQEYIDDKNQRPSAMLPKLHYFAQRDLVQKLSGYYP